MYKSYEELSKMGIREIAEYVDYLEKYDDAARRNDIEYVEWCGDVLDDVLFELDAYEEFERILFELGG